MSQAPFIGFGDFSRPEIGLISDGSQNLSEIFESDKREALRNILLSPETLDSIYGLSSVVNREDFRAVSGLSRLLLPSLNVQSEVFTEVIPRKLYENKEFYTPQYPLGGSGSTSTKQPNVIIFNGLIKCEGAEYFANTIGDRLFSNPVKQRVSISTSRASLFSTSSNSGQILKAKYSGTIRVRKRSHVNRIIVPGSLFISKAPITENPSHRIRINVDNGDTGVTTPVDLLATKNSPLRVFCRIGKGSIKFTFTDTQAPYFFGYQIQPVQQRPNTPFVEFLPTPSVFQATGSREFILDLDLTGTGYQNLYDLYLYLYVNPEKVRGIEFIDINLKETPDRKDLGLIGFNNLESFVVSGGSLTILPLWLKTLGSKLRTLDLANSGNTWRSGPMGWFDIRDPSATPSPSFQSYTASSYLTIPKAGVFVNREGDDWSDELFEKYITNAPRVAGTDYRVFSALSTIRLGDKFNGRSPRFDDITPNLSTLNWSGNIFTQGRYLFGDLPKLANNGQLINYNISVSGAQGNIEQIGTSTNPSNSGHISKYKVVTFNVSSIEGNTLTNVIEGYIGDPSQDWSAWRDNAASINMSRSGSNIRINLQSSTWKFLVSLGADRCGGVTFSSPSTALRVPKLSSLNIDYSQSSGPLPSLGVSPTENTGELTSISAFGCNSISPITTNGVRYLFPLDFAPARPSDSGHKLSLFRFGDSTPEYRIRKNDLVNLYRLTRLELYRTGVTGRLPSIPLSEFPETNPKRISVSTRESNIYDARGLSINSTNNLISRDIDGIDCSFMNVGGGGALLPTFEGNSRSTVKFVLMSGSLPSTYSNDWSDISKRGSIISSEDAPTEISGLTISRTVQSSLGAPWTQDDDIFRLVSSSSGLRQRVLVNDSVRLTANGQEVARVLSVSNTEIVIDRDIPGTLPSSLFFTRNITEITNWFNGGFSEIENFNAANCRLSGTLNLGSGFSKVVDRLFIAIDFSNNLINGYVSGSLSRVFSGNPRAITVDLSRNRLSVSNIYSIIDDVFAADSRRRFTNCIVRVGGNKINSGGRYVNYTQAELFPTTVREGQDIVTQLTRNEQFYTFTTVTTTDESGNTLTEKVITGTRTISIPGQLIGGTYYKTKRDRTRQTIENPSGVKLRNLRGIRIDLGFTYITPVTGVFVFQTLYENSTTRYGSIIEAGYNPGDLVNP